MSVRPSVDAAKLDAVRARLRALRRGATPGRREADKLAELRLRFGMSDLALPSARGKRGREEDMGADRGSKHRRVMEQIAARGKRGRENGGPSQPKRRTQAGFVTKSGKVVSFKLTGKRKRDLKQKIRSGQAKCMVDPITGRAVREGTRKFKKMAKSGAPVKMER